MDIPCSKVEKILNLLNNMCDSYSEEINDKIYEEFSTYAQNDAKVLNYFNENWHSIREDWTTYGINKVVNFGNLTTNRIESNHSKLKQPSWMKPNDSLVNAIKNLFEWFKFRKAN